MNVLMFVLATIPAVFTATVAVAAPASGARPTEVAALNLTLLITAEGVSLKTSGGAVGKGCEPGRGIAVPTRDGHQDWAALTACAARLKAALPGGRDAERDVRVLADPGTDYQSVIQAMDAVREAPDGGVLFPDVTFGVAR